MCGIVGYIGNEDARAIVLKGLKELEPCEYDSAGIALLNDAKFAIIKRAGSVSELEDMCRSISFSVSVGLGHLRRATCGEVNGINAHPHLDCTEQIAVVHNGSIENCDSLRRDLEAKGHRFRSNTDSETVVHLIEEYCRRTNNFQEAVLCALSEVEGKFGIVVLTEKEPEKMFAARRGVPLIVGIGKEGYWVASDVNAFENQASGALYLDDNEIAILTKEGVKINPLKTEMIKEKFSN
jgi:glutamine---fructose-6-phosphate transaminase (isomerizing)